MPCLNGTRVRKSVLLNWAPEGGEFTGAPDCPPGCSWSLDRRMLPNYNLNIHFRRVACHPAALWSGLNCLPCKRCVGGWAQIQEVRTPGSRWPLGPQLLSCPPCLRPCSLHITGVLRVGCHHLESVHHQSLGAGRKHRNVCRYLSSV